MSIKASINKGFSQKLSDEFPNIVPIEKLPIIPKNITPGWFSGFTSGEGSFLINIYKNSKKTGYKTSLRFTIVQHIRDKALLESFISFFNCGVVYAHGSNACRFVVSNFSDINEKIIPIFKQHPVLGIKSLDFVSFCLRSWQQK